MTGKLFADGEIHGATNRAEGYFNIQGSTMTAYGLPLNSLKLQLLFQGKKTNLTNFEIWSGSDRLQCSGVIENKWPHHYEGNITAQSSNLSEKLNRIFHYSRNEKAAKADGARQTKDFDQGCMSPYCPDQERDEISGLIPFLQQSCSKVSDSWLTKIPNSFFKNLSNLHGGTFQGTWKGDGEATYHQGSFQFTLHDLVHNLHKVRGESEGCYGPEWISFSHLMWEEDTKKYNGQLTLSSQGINLQNFSLKDNGVLTLSGKAFLPLDARLLLQQPFSLSQALQHNLPLDVHLQCHHFIINHESNIGVLAESLADNEKQRAYKETFDDSNPAAMQLAGLSKKSIFPWHLLPTFFDGTIDASGLYEKPTLHVSLIGREREKLTPVLKFNLSAEQGSGIIDTTWTLEKNKTVTLQGKLPVGLMIQKESAPLKEAERWSLGISSAPLDLKLCISSLSFDDIATHFLPSFFHIEKSFISGNLTCKGTLGQPEPDGELQLQAAGIMMGSKIPSLHHLQGRLFFNKDKMEWRDATAWVGKEKVTMSGTTEWYHQKHDYHFSGTHLLLYQSTLANVTGALNLSLQGENTQGTLHGNVTVREVEGSPKLFVTPFLIPPGIELASLISTNTPAPWSINVTMTTPAEPAATRVSCPFKNINLHLTGDLFSPSLEGNIILQELPIIFPNMTMRLIEGSCSFEANKPWQPIYHLTANGTSHHHQKIGVTLLNNHILQFQSDPFTSPTTLALQLSQQDQEAWIFQLPYWIREQSLMEPTTLAEPTSLHNSLETRNDLGFIGCEIFYQAEMK